MTGFLVVKFMTGEVVVECAALETLDAIMVGRGPEFVAIMSDRTIYDSPLDMVKVLEGISILKTFRNIYRYSKG